MHSSAVAIYPSLRLWVSAKFCPLLLASESASSSLEQSSVERSVPRVLQLARLRGAILPSQEALNFLHILAFTLRVCACREGPWLLLLLLEPLADKPTRSLVAHHDCIH